jgi:DNA modification methylase
MTAAEGALVFRSRLEDLMPAVELDFPPTPAFGDYRPYLDHAVSHPAKANTKLLEFLITKYTKEGDVVLDPMAGSGSSGVVAALHGRDAILVDIEPRYYEFMVRAKEKVERAQTLSRKGRITCILGDARELSRLLRGIDVCITSPPYGDVNMSGGDVERRVERLLRAGYDPRDYVHGRAANAVLRHYGEDEDTGMLAKGVDAVVTSPPYEQILSHERHATPNTGRTERLRAEKRLWTYPPNSSNNIGNLPLGPVDVIITSPPYTNTACDDPGGIGKYRKGGAFAEEKLGGLAYTEGNISNLPVRPEDADAIGQAESDGDRGESVLRLYRRLVAWAGRPTYLSEMLLVYREMYRVLRPGGRAVVIVKPFSKERRVVDLPYYTYLLMAKVGFTLEALYKLRLEQQSFWKVLYYRKNSDVPRIMHEYVLVCRKPVSP